MTVTMQQVYLWLVLRLLFLFLFFAPLFFSSFFRKHSNFKFYSDNFFQCSAIPTPQIPYVTWHRLKHFSKDLDTAKCLLLTWHALDFQYNSSIPIYTREPHLFLSYIPIDFGSNISVSIFNMFSTASCKIFIVMFPTLPRPRRYRSSHATFYISH